MADSDKQAALNLTEDGKVRTTNKMLVAIVTCAVLGTVYFLGVLYSIRDLKATVEQNDAATKARLRYLFRATDTPDPWEGEARASSTALPRATAPTP